MSSIFFTFGEFFAPGSRGAQAIRKRAPPQSAEGRLTLHRGETFARICGKNQAQRGGYEAASKLAVDFGVDVPATAPPDGSLNRFRSDLLRCQQVLDEYHYSTYSAPSFRQSRRCSYASRFYAVGR